MQSTFRSWRAAGRVCRTSPAAVLLAFLGLPAPAAAAATGLTVEDPWIRFIVPGNPAAGYFTLINLTTAPATLVSASSPDCGALTLHKTVSQKGLESMAGIKNVVVPAHGQIAFAPGSYHLMCMGPSAAMTRGAIIPVTLKFADGSSLAARFPVRGATGR